MKPSSEVSLAQNKLFALIDEGGFPTGVVNPVNGSRDVADVFLESTDVRGISVVGATLVAKYVYVYSKATASGKRAQCQGGAKNFFLVMQDVPVDKIMPAIMNSVILNIRRARP